MSEVPSYGVEIQPTIVIKEVISDRESVIIARSYDPEQNIPAFIEATAAHIEETDRRARREASMPLQKALIALIIPAAPGLILVEEHPNLGNSLTAVGGVAFITTLACVLVKARKENGRPSPRAEALRNMSEAQRPAQTSPQPQ